MRISMSSLFRKIYRLLFTPVSYVTYGIILTLLSAQGYKVYLKYKKEKERRENAALIHEAFEMADKELRKMLRDKIEEENKQSKSELKVNESKNLPAVIPNIPSSIPSNYLKDNSNYLKDNSQKRLDKIDEILRNQSFRKMREK